MIDWNDKLSISNESIYFKIKIEKGLIFVDDLWNESGNSTERYEKESLFLDKTKHRLFSKQDREPRPRTILNSSIVILNNWTI